MTLGSAGTHRCNGRGEPATPGRLPCPPRRCLISGTADSARRGTMVLGRCAALAGAVLAGAAVVPAVAAGQAQPVWDLRVASFRAPSAIEIGERAAVSGQVAPRAAVPVVIERMEGATWTPLVTLRSRRDGRFAARLPLRVPGSL